MPGVLAVDLDFELKDDVKPIKTDKADMKSRAGGQLHLPEDLLPTTLLARDSTARF